MDKAVIEKLLSKPAPSDCLAAQNALKLGGYIKGYGTQGRVMDKEHRPLFNISKLDLQWLQVHDLIRQANNVWILNELTTL